MSSYYIGEIRMFAGSFAPVGWAFCDGSLLPIADYDALYSLIGTTYGGDGQTTFGLPDLRGRVVAGTGQGVGLSSRLWGDRIGAESTTLTSGNLPAHSHLVGAATTSPSSATQVPTSSLGLSSNLRNQPAIFTATGPAATAMAAAAVGSAGSAQPLSVIHPYVAVNFIIATVGIYPV